MLSQILKKFGKSCKNDVFRHERQCEEMFFSRMSYKKLFPRFFEEFFEVLLKCIKIWTFFLEWKNLEELKNVGKKICYRSRECPGVCLKNVNKAATVGQLDSRRFSILTGNSITRHIRSFESVFIIILLHMWRRIAAIKNNTRRWEIHSLSPNFRSAQLRQFNICYHIA